MPCERSESAKSEGEAIWEGKKGNSPTRIATSFFYRRIPRNDIPQTLNGVKLNIVNVLSVTRDATF